MYSNVDRILIIKEFVGVSWIAFKVVLTLIKMVLLNCECI